MDGSDLLQLVARVVPSWWQPELREDAMQQAVEQLLRMGIDARDPRASMVARNSAIDEWRRQQRAAVGDPLTGLEVDRADAIEAIIIADACCAAAGDDDRQRVVVALLSWGYTRKEIARLLRVDVKTIARALD